MLFLQRHVPSLKSLFTSQMTKDQGFSAIESWGRKPQIAHLAPFVLKNGRPGTDAEVQQRSWHNLREPPNLKEVCTLALSRHTANVDHMDFRKNRNSMRSWSSFKFQALIFSTIAFVAICGILKCPRAKAYVSNAILFLGSEISEQSDNCDLCSDDEYFGEK